MANIKIANLPSATVTSSNDFLILDQSDSTKKISIENFIDYNNILIGSETPFLTPEMFGAVGDGVTDDRPSIQSALDAAYDNYKKGSGPVVVQGSAPMYMVSLNPESTLIPGEVAAGRGGLNLYSNITLQKINLVLNSATTGTSSGAILTNWKGSADNVKLINISIDGGYGTITGSGITAINIVDSDNVLIDSNTIKNSSSGGIYLRRSSTNTYGCSNSKVINNNISNVGYIGIQCERPNNVIINNNIVNTSVDNGIDIFGNETSETGQGYANNVIISNNITNNTSVGVFIESCGNVTIKGNRFISFSNTGVFFNRINTAAYNCVVEGNTITGADNTLSVGIKWKNACGYTSVYNNKITSCVDSFSSTVGMIYVDIGENYHSDITRCILYVSKVSNGLVYSRMKSQYITGQMVNGIPYNTTPRDYPSSNNTRFYRNSISAPYSAYAATTAEDNFVRATGTLPSNSGWGPGFSLYNTVVIGETVIAIGSSTITAGEYLLINGYYYLVYSTASSYCSVRKWDVTTQSFISGDYTSYLSSAYTYSIYRSIWGTL